MINILITGSNGQLGSELKSISNDLLGYNFFTTKKNLDIVKKSEIESFVVNKKVDLIINCAAYNNVDKAEIDNQTAREVNELGVKNIGEICKTYKFH